MGDRSPKSVQSPRRRWMNCSHLPSNARTRWVTERIASLSTGSARTRVRNQTDEMTGSKGALQNGFLRQQCQTDLKKKLGTKTFLPVDIRPNGRLLHGSCL